MLRRDMLVLLWLGVLSACGPTEPERAPLARPLTSQALASATTPPKGPIEWTHYWTGNSGPTGTAGNCLSCRSPSGYACPTVSSGAWEVGLEAQTIPAGHAVSAVTATVHGASIGSGSGSQGPTLTAQVTLNGKQLRTTGNKNLESTSRACSGAGVATGCDTAVVLQRTSDVVWNTGTTPNMLKFTMPAPSASVPAYCVSHVQMSLTLVERRIAVSPSPLAFQEQKTGETRSMGLTITNDGDATLTVSSITIEQPVGKNAFSLPKTTPTSFTVDAGKSKTIQVEFTPGRGESYGGTLKLASNAENPETLVTLSGQGVEDSVVFEENLDFGDQRVLKETQKSITVRNISPSAVTIKDFEVTGGDSGFSRGAPTGALFVLSGNTVTDGSDAKTLWVKFKPPSANATPEASFKGSFKFKTSQGVFTPEVTNRTVTLEGRGVQPQLTFEPTTKALSFEPLRVGALSPTKTLTVSNLAGTGPITFKKIAVTPGVGGDFTLETPIPAGGITLSPADAPLALQVHFQPKVEGASSAKLTLTDSDDEDHPILVDLNGTGLMPHLEFTPADKLAPFGLTRKGLANTYDVYVTNSNGSAPITFKSIKVEGGDPAFTLVSPVVPTGGLVLNPTDESLKVRVQFLPTAIGFVESKLRFTSDDPDNLLHEVKLTGTGFKPTLAFSPTNKKLAFNDRRVGLPSELEFEVSNSEGSGPIKFKGIAVTGNSAFTLVSPKLAPGETLELKRTDDPLKVKVQFLPALKTDSSVIGTLELTSDDADYLRTTVELSGRGVAPHLVFNPEVGEAFSFGDRRVGVAVKRTMRVSNDGNKSITLQKIEKTGPGAFTVLRPTAENIVLAPNATPLDVEVQFLPTDGELDGELSLRTDDKEHDPVKIGLKGKGVKPTLVFEPLDRTVRFNARRVGGEFTEWVRVKNGGSSDITLKTISMTNTAGGVFALVTAIAPEGITLSPSDPALALQVRFQPKDIGDVSGVLTLTSEDKDYTNITVQLHGTGVQPELEFTPKDKKLLFGEQRVATPAKRSFWISNKGSGPITFKTISVTGNGVFSLVKPSVSEQGIDLRPTDAPLEVEVQFHPTVENASEDVTGTLTLTSEDSAYPSIGVALSGRGVKPLLDINTRTVSFVEPVNVGQTSTATQDVILTNKGSGTLKVSAITRQGDFSVTPAGPFELVGLNSTRTLSVRFTPTEKGPRPGSLSFTTNDEGANKDVSVDLHGTGALLLSVSKVSIPFGDVKKGGSKSETFVVSNNGTAPITVNAVSIAPSTAPYKASIPGNSVVLRPGSPSVTVTVTFEPTKAGPEDAKLTLGGTADNNPEVELTGKGTAPKIKLLVGALPDGSPLDFGRENVGKKKDLTVTIQNTGDAVLNLYEPSIEQLGSVFSYVSPTKREINSGDSINLGVSFTPTEENRFNGSLNVPSDADSVPAKLSLRGQGVLPILQVEENVSFGNQQLGHDSALVDVAIANKGEGTLSIKQLTPSTPFRIVSPAALPSPEAPWELAKDDTRTIRLTFKPTDVGQAMGSLSISSNAPTKAVTLKGIGIDSNPSCAPDCAVEFIDKDVSPPVAYKQTVRITNVIALNDHKLILRRASVTTASGTNPFTLSGFEENKELSPGNFHEFFVVFDPRERGEFRGTITVETDASRTPNINVSVLGKAKGAEITVNRPRIAFGPVEVNTTGTTTVSVTNGGEKALSIYSISFQGKSTDGGTASGEDMSLDFTTEPLGDGGTGLQVPANGGTVPISFRFAPRAIGLREAQAVFSSNVKPLTVDVVGEGTSALLELSRNEVNIDGVVVGTSSPSETITIFNKGKSPVRIARVAMSPPTAATFFYVSYPGSDAKPPAGPELLPGGSMEVSVVYTPTANDLASHATLRVEPENTRVPSVSIQLHGSGVNEPLRYPSDVAFGKQPINHGVTRQVKLVNRSNIRINVSDVRVEGSGCTQYEPSAKQFYVETSGGADGGTASEREVSLGIAFLPIVVGPINCTLKLMLAESKPVEIALRGEGIATALSVNPATIDFGSLRAGAKKSDRLTLKNESNEPIELADVEERYWRGTKFVLTPSSLNGVMLAPGASTSVTVVYEPTEQTNSEANLWFGTKKPNVPHSVDVSLKATVKSRILSTNEPFLDFGKVDANKGTEVRFLDVKNDSSVVQFASARLKSGSSTNSPFSVDDSELPKGIQPGASARLLVKFVPTRVESHSDEILISLDGFTETEVAVPVDGVGRSLLGNGSGCSSSASSLGGVMGVLSLLSLIGLRRRRHE